MKKYRINIGLSDNTTISSTSVIPVPSKTSDLMNTSNFITSDQLSNRLVNWWYYNSSLTRTVNSSVQTLTGYSYITSMTKINNSDSTTVYGGTTGIYNGQLNRMTSINIKVGDLIFTSYGEIGCVVDICDVGTARNSAYLKYRTRWMSNMQWYCLEEGTRIKMFDGTEKPIEEVQKGDSILGWDFENEQPIEAVAVFSRFTHRDDKTNYVVFSNGEYLSTTDDHYIYCVNKGRDAPVTELQEGDVCLDSEGNEIEIYAIHRGIYGMGMKNYYHVVSSNNTYFANNVMNAAHPINKFNWMAYANGEEIPEEVMNILRQDAEEFNTFEFLVKNDDFRRQSVALTKEIKTRGNERDRLKQYLADTDYVAIKYSEGKEIDENILVERQNARDRINQLTDEIDNIYLPAYNQLVTDYSPLGADTLLSNEERRTKYFKIANKRDNEALNIFKQYYQPHEEEEEEEE